MRLKMAVLFVFARLSWGNLLSPLYQKNTLRKMFPPPRKSVYKKGLVDYFFKN